MQTSIRSVFMLILDDLEFQDELLANPQGALSKRGLVLSSSDMEFLNNLVQAESLQGTPAELFGALANIANKDMPLPPPWKTIGRRNYRG